MDLEIGVLSRLQYANSECLQDLTDSGCRQVVACINPADRDFFSDEGFAIRGTKFANGSPHLLMAKTLNASGDVIGRRIVARARAGQNLTQAPIPSVMFTAPTSQELLESARKRQVVEFAAWVESSKEEASRPILAGSCPHTEHAIDDDSWTQAVTEYKQTIAEAMNQVFGLQEAIKEDENESLIRC